MFCWRLCSAAPEPLVHPPQGFPRRDEQWGSSAVQVQRAGVSAVSSALWRVVGRQGCRLGGTPKSLVLSLACAGMFSTTCSSRLYIKGQTTTASTGPSPAQPTRHLCLIDTSDNGTHTLLTARQPPNPGRHSSCSSAGKPTLYKYQPDAVPRLRTLVSRTPCAFTADSDDNNDGHNARPD